MKLVPWYSETIKPGQKYERLTVISTHKIAGTYRYIAKCRCDCGTEPLYIRVDKLRGSKGLTLSCGCFHKDRVTKHGAWGNPIFNVWSGMMRRCYNPKDKRYKDYGGRGITVCYPWHDVRNFIADMTDGYQKGLQIDRIDNNKGYSKENCRWADRYTQRHNRRGVVLFSFNGKTLCLTDWSKHLRIPFTCLRQRIDAGWPIEKAFTTTVMSNKESLAIALKTRWPKNP